MTTVPCAGPLPHSPPAAQAGRADSHLGSTLAQLIDVMEIALWEIDRNYRVVGSNRKARELYGEATEGCLCYQIAAHSDTVCPQCPAQQVFDGQESGRSERQRVLADGRTIYIDHIATPIRNQNGLVTGALVLIIDITRQKEQEQELIAHRNTMEQMVIERTRELAQSHDRYRQLYEESRQGQALYLSLLNAAADAIMICDLHDRVLFVNPSFTRTFGWPIEEIKGQPQPFAAAMQNDQTATAFASLKQTGHPVSHLLCRRQTKAGALLDVSISAARYSNPANEPAGIISSFRDLTEAKALELQLHRAQKFEALGTMASGIAHDFNNLLMGIQGNASLMLLDLPRGRIDSAKLKHIEKYVKQGESLTRQLLSLARREVRYEVQSVNINELLTSCASLFGRTKKDIAIHSTLQHDVWPIEADPGQVEQVLLNLFVNAAHAMPMGGTLMLRTGNVETEAGGNLSDTKPGRAVRITVTDTGHGIPPDILDKIFDPFFSTKEKEGGTGLGLASAQSIMTSHGGMIRASNSKAGGAQFTLLFPASTREVASSPPLDEALPTGSETILLVDDEELVLNVTKELLERLGYSVLPASSSTEALRIYQERGSAIDLAILDVVMPGMNGADLFRRLREHNRALKIMLSTGHGLAGPAAEALALGCNGYIQKPFTLQDIAKKIRILLP